MMREGLTDGRKRGRERAFGVRGMDGDDVALVLRLLVLYGGGGGVIERSDWLSSFSVSVVAFESDGEMSVELGRRGRGRASRDEIRG